MSDPKQTLSASSKTFPIASTTVWYCVQTTSTKEHGTVYTPPSPSLSGTCSTAAAGGHVDLNFNVTEAGDGTYTVEYKITHKPFIVTEGEVWDGIQKTINECSSS